jgi:hypothetical protein
MLLVYMTPSHATVSDDHVNGIYLVELGNHLSNIMVEHTFNGGIDASMASAKISDIYARVELNYAASLTDDWYQDLVLGRAQVYEINANGALNAAVKLESIKNISLASLDIFSLGTSAYKTGKDLGALWNGQGSWIGNTASLSSNLLSLATTSTSLASHVPLGAWSNSWAYTDFAKTMRSGWGGKLNTVLIYAKFEAELYAFMRDNTIDEIKSNLINAHKSTQDGRKIQVDKLVNLFWNMMSATPRVAIGKQDIIDELSDYLILHDTIAGTDLILWKQFLALSLNSTYLQNEFGVTDFESLTSLQRIHVALDALAEMSFREDMNFISTLQESVTNGFNWNDILVGAFQGSGGYEIFDVEDLKAALVPCYDISVSGCITYEYYRKYLRSEVDGAIAGTTLDMATEIGQIAATLDGPIDIDISHTYENYTIEPTETTVGYTVTMHDLDANIIGDTEIKSGTVTAIGGTSIVGSLVLKGGGR